MSDLSICLLTNCDKVFKVVEGAESEFYMSRNMCVCVTMSDFSIWRMLLFRDYIARSIFHGKNKEENG